MSLTNLTQNYMPFFQKWKTIELAKKTIDPNHNSHIDRAILFNIPVSDKDLRDTSDLEEKIYEWERLLLKAITKGIAYDSHDYDPEYLTYLISEKEKEEEIEDSEYRRQVASDYYGDKL